MIEGPKLAAIPYPELHKDVGQVGLDGRLTDAQFVGHLLIAQATRRVPHDLVLTATEALSQERLCGVGRGQAGGERLYDPRWGARQRGDGPYAQMIATMFAILAGRTGWSAFMKRMNAARSVNFSAGLLRRS